MASIHETAEGLHETGVMDKQTIQIFDEACLTPVRQQPVAQPADCGIRKAPDAA